MREQLDKIFEDLLHGKTSINETKQNVIDLLNNNSICTCKEEEQDIYPDSGQVCYCLNCNRVINDEV